MEIRTYQGTTFSVAPVDQDLDNYEIFSSLHDTGDLTNPQDLVRLASVIIFAERLGIDLDLSID